MKEYEIEISRSQRNLDMDLPGDLVFGVPGPQGPQGPQGPEGKPGETPVRGTDYWTEDDKAEIKSYVDDAVAQKSVILYTAQDLTEEQKAQARANIGASAVRLNLDNGVLSIE